MWWSRRLKTLHRVTAAQCRGACIIDLTGTLVGRQIRTAQDPRGGCSRGAEQASAVQQSTRSRTEYATASA